MTWILKNNVESGFSRLQWSWSKSEIYWQFTDESDLAGSAFISRTSLLGKQQGCEVSRDQLKAEACNGARSGEMALCAFRVAEQQAW